MLLRFNWRCRMLLLPVILAALKSNAASMAAIITLRSSSTRKDTALRTDDSLTQMEHAGSVVTFTDPPSVERDRISRQFEALRLQGHAIISDVTIGNGEVEVYRVFH